MSEDVRLIAGFGALGVAVLCALWLLRPDVNKGTTVDGPPLDAVLSIATCREACAPNAMRSYTPQKCECEPRVGPGGTP